MELDSTTIFIIELIAAAISLGILYWIIESATRSKKILRQLEINSELLALIAKKETVSHEEIQDLIDQLDNPDNTDDQSNEK